MVAGKQPSPHLLGDAERPEAAVSLRWAAGTGMDAAEVEFLAEKELVTIIPNFSLDKIYLIGVRAPPRYLPRPGRVKPVPGRGRAARASADADSPSSLSTSRMGSWEEDSACPTRGGLRGGGRSKFWSQRAWRDPRRYPVPPRCSRASSPQRLRKPDSGELSGALPLKRHGAASRGSVITGACVWTQVTQCSFSYLTAARSSNALALLCLR